jgi:hypothetical protein
LDVFLIPFGRDRYELYCEHAPDPDAAPAAPGHGVIARAKARVADFLHRAEALRHAGPREPAAGWFARLNDHAMAWVAERIAEQRLLWNLRWESAATIVHPDDLTFTQAHTLVQRTLERDRQRHQKWIWIDGFLFLATFILLGPLFLLIPGVPNLPALFFGFRTVGHWYSGRGALHGLRRVEWTGRASAPLTELRGTAGLGATERDAQLVEIARRLSLPHLPTFYERVAVS